MNIIDNQIRNKMGKQLIITQFDYFDLYVMCV